MGHIVERVAEALIQKGFVFKEDWFEIELTEEPTVRCLIYNQVPILFIDDEQNAYQKYDEVKKRYHEFWNFMNHFAAVAAANGYAEQTPTYMSIGEILELPTEEQTEWQLNDVIGYIGKHLDGHEQWGYKDREKRLERKIHKDVCYDTRRVWQLCSVWFDGKPAMITQEAGREGDDHVESFVIDGELYEQMADYIQEQIRIQDREAKEASGEKAVGLGLDYRGKELTHFYGCNIHNVEESMKPNY